MKINKNLNIQPQKLAVTGKKTVEGPADQVKLGENKKDDALTMGDKVKDMKRTQLEDLTIGCQVIGGLFDLAVCSAAGGALGAIGGTLGMAALGAGPIGTIGGLAGGMVLGGYIGGKLSTYHDIGK